VTHRIHRLYPSLKKANAADASSKLRAIVALARAARKV